MNMRRIVIDTNVFVAALRSMRGVSHRLLLLVGSGAFEISLSVPLVLEYEAVAKRMASETTLSNDDIEGLLDYLCAVANRQRIHYLWRPFLRDPGDDMILELAVAASCDTIVTYNLRDFAGAEHFDICIMTPKDFLQEIGGLK